MTDQTDTTQPTTPVQCDAAKDPAVRLTIAMGLAFALGVWCIIDLGHYPYKPLSEDVNAFFGWMFNHVCAVLGPAIGLVLLGFLIRYLRRKLVADGEGIGYLGKAKIAWQEVKTLDASELPGKGIVVLHYGDGQEMKLDGWKLTNFKKLIALIESSIPAEKIQRTAPPAEN
jgi:hypothetical protein